MYRFPPTDEINRVVNMVRDKNTNWSPTRKLYDIVLQKEMTYNTQIISTAYNEWIIIESFLYDILDDTDEPISKRQRIN
jgi:hypothetical protein